MRFKLYLRLKVLFIALFTTATINSFSQFTNVLICGSPVEPAWNDDVKAKLESSGQFSSVSIFNINTGTPTVALLQKFDAVLVYTDARCRDCSLLGNNLAAYIDSGGGVVAAVFATASIPVGGNFNTVDYQVIIPASQIQDSEETLGKVWIAGHPLMNGVNSFSGGTNSFRSTSTLLAPGGYRIADWSDGRFLIAARDSVGASKVSRVDLGFFPPSNDARPDFWVAATNGAQIMANALSYVAGNTSSCPAPYNLRVSSITDSSALLKWNFPSSPVSRFRIRYRPLGSPGIERKYVAGDRNSKHVYGLMPGTSYEWQVRNSCTEDTSAWIYGPVFTTAFASFSLHTGAANDSKVQVKTGMQVMPNPARGNFSVQMHLPAKEALTTLALYNSLGIKVWQQAQGKLSGTVNRYIALEGKLPAGVYTLTALRSDVMLMQKVIIIN